MWYELVCLLAVLLTLLAYLDTKKPKNFPPGPKWLPIIGCALELRSWHKKFGSLSKASYELSLKYGPMVGLRIGRRYAVLFNGFKALQELVIKEEFNGRPDDLYTTSRTWGKRMGVAFNDSHEQREQRAFVLQKFRTCGFRKQDLEANLGKGARDLINDIGDTVRENSVVRLDTFIETNITNTVWHLLSGDEITLTKTEVDSFVNAMKDFSNTISVEGDLFNYLPFLIHICPNYCGYTTYVNVHENLTRFIRKKIKSLQEAHIQKLSHGLIQEYFNIVGNSDRKSSFSEDQLVVICLDLLIGGFGTSYSAINFAFLYLILNPDVQKKAQDEIDRVVGRDRLPSLEDKTQLQYVDCIVLETIRLFVGRSLNLPHRALTDVFVNGYLIPKDTILLGNFRDVLLNANEWKDPKVFSPERYMKDGRLVCPETYMPFGGGKRRCLGEPFARSNTFLTVATVLHQFNLEAVPNAPPSTKFVESFVPCVKPFEVIVTLR